MSKQPSGYLPMDRYGYGLWEVWYDSGPQTFTQPVMNTDGTVRVWMLDSDAGVWAREAAALKPARRFKVVQAR